MVFYFRKRKVACEAAWLQVYKTATVNNALRMQHTCPVFKEGWVPSSVSPGPPWLVSHSAAATALRRSMRHPFKVSEFWRENTNGALSSQTPNIFLCHPKVSRTKCGYWGGGLLSSMPALNLLCSWGGPWIADPPSSTPWMLCLQACTPHLAYTVLGSNPGLHADRTSTLPVAPYPQIWLFRFKILFFLYLFPAL